MRASILVPTWGRPGPLRRCLGAALAEAGEAAEVLTIHGPGDGEALALVRRELPAVRALVAQKRNLAAQRNQGVRAARGEAVVFLDDDAWPRPGWLEALLAPLADPAVAAAGGRVLHADGREQYGPMAVTPLGRPFRLARAEERPPRLPLTLPGGNLAVRRAALVAAGGFDENYGYHFDDVDLCQRLFRLGFRLAYAPAAEVLHESLPGPHRRTFWDRDWYTVTKNSVYFACRHAGPLALAFGPAALQLPKAARFVAWAVRGRLRPAALLRCLAGQAGGLLAGYAKGFLRPPILPLAGEGEP